MAYPLEARLRPAHELGAASVSALGAALVLSSPGWGQDVPPAPPERDHPVSRELPEDFVLIPEKC